MTEFLRRNLGPTLGSLILLSCGSDSGPVSAIYPNMEALQTLEGVAPLTSLSEEEIKALKSTTSNLVLVGLYDHFDPDSEDSPGNEESCSKSGKVVLQKRTERSNDKAFTGERITLVNLQDCRYNMTFNNSGHEVLVSGSLATAVTGKGSAQSPGTVTQNPIIIAQSNSGNLDVTIISSGAKQSLSFSNLLYAAKVSSQTQVEYNEISQDPLGPEVIRERKLEFWAKLLKCSGTVTINGQKLGCAQVAITLIPYLFIGN